MTNRTASETIINLLGKQYAKNSPKPNVITQLPLPEHFLRINPPVSRNVGGYDCAERRISYAAPVCGRLRK